MTFKPSALLAFTLWLVSPLLLAQPMTESGISLDSQWKTTVYDFAKNNLSHTAWGLEHYERNYLLGLRLAQEEALVVDEEVLFAAAFLHDMGVFEPYVVDAAEHSQTAADNIESVLIPAGFPVAKIEAVKQAVLAHMFYAQVPDDATATVLHDADTLDFLGIIGVTRILSLSTRHAWATDLTTAVATLRGFSEQLPASLKTKTAVDIGQQRVTEMTSFLDNLDKQSFNNTAL